MDIDYHIARIAGLENYRKFMYIFSIHQLPQETLLLPQSLLLKVIFGTSNEQKKIRSGFTQLRNGNKADAQNTTKGRSVNLVGSRANQIDLTP